MTNVFTDTIESAKKAKEKKQKAYQRESDSLSSLLQKGVDKAGEYGLEKPAAGLAAAVQTGHSLLREPSDSIVGASTISPKPSQTGSRAIFRKDGKSLEELDSPKAWKSMLDRKKSGQLGEKLTPEAKMKWLRKVESRIEGYKVPENLALGKIDEEVNTVKKMLEAERLDMDIKSLTRGNK